MDLTNKKHVKTRVVENRHGIKKLFMSLSMFGANKLDGIFFSTFRVDYVVE